MNRTLFKLSKQEACRVRTGDWKHALASNRLNATQKFEQVLTKAKVIEDSATRHELRNKK
jgi:hypothetical protein